uniref:Mitochondrial glycoprotein n=1 Tax=Kalanchoe fedtschenkoi TaxID=63787 RepID=A0A7N0RHM8_KALFE
MVSCRKTLPSTLEPFLSVFNRSLLMAAFMSLLRRASFSPTLPLAIRRALLPKCSGAAAINYQKNGSVGCRGIGFHLPLFSFFTAAASVPSETLDADESLIRIINGEIKLATKEIAGLKGEKPAAFPFKIQDNPGAKTVTLKRKFRNELITVLVDLANGPVDVKRGDGDDQDHDQVSVPLSVTIDKGLDLRLEFGVTAYPDEIVVEYMVTKSPNTSDHGVPYEGRDFRDLEEKMQKAVFEYLAVRGIEPNVTGFMIGYMMIKGGKEYLPWLKNLRKFCH